MLSPPQASSYMTQHAAPRDAHADLRGELLFDGDLEIAAPSAHEVTAKEAGVLRLVRKTGGSHSDAHFFQIKKRTP